MSPTQTVHVSPHVQMALFTSLPPKPVLRSASSITFTIQFNRDADVLMVWPSVKTTYAYNVHHSTTSTMGTV
jgi:hypothetical protein